MVAAYRASTKRILLIHDDDLLDPAFGEAYETVIGPCLDRRDAGFASWNAELQFDDGTRAPAPYFAGTSTVMPSKHFAEVILQRGARTFSPCVSVFNRTVLIRACKEAAETLRSNPSLERPGMLLGTEILVYLRHCQAFKRWLHLDRVLSYYGHHAGSGTVIHQANHTEHVMAKGYDLARDQGLCRPPQPTPRIIFVHSVHEPKDPDVRKAQEAAQKSWAWHFQTAEFIDCPHTAPAMPTIRTLLDYGCAFALPEDIVVYGNSDAGLSTHAYERIVAGVERGRGVTCLGHHTVAESIAGPIKNLYHLKQPGRHRARGRDPSVVGPPPRKDAGHVHRARGVGFGVRRAGRGMGRWERAPRCQQFRKLGEVQGAHPERLLAQGSHEPMAVAATGRGRDPRPQPGIGEGILCC